MQQLSKSNSSGVRIARKNIPIMNNLQPEKKLMMRRIVLMVLSVLVLVGGGTLGWNYLAAQVEARLDQRVGRLAEQGQILECENHRVEGYPFRIGLFCDRVLFADESRKILFKAGELRSAAQFYQPGLVIGELDGPAELQAPDLGDLKLEWKLARSSSRVALGGLKRVSLELEDLAIAGVNGKFTGLTITELSLLELHLRPGGGDTSSPDIDAVVDGNGIRFGEISGVMLPDLSIKTDGVISDLNLALKNRQDVGDWIRSNGLKVQFHKLEVNLENGGSFSASGPLRVNSDGLLSGNLDVEVVDIEVLVRNITRQIPQLGETAQTLQVASKVFASGAGNGKMRVKIQIRQSNVMMGFIPLGIIPRLF
jgi:hypothetical protein